MAMIYRELGEPAQADACLTKTQTLPKPAVNWQGAWWEHIIPHDQTVFPLGIGAGAELKCKVVGKSD